MMIPVNLTGPRFTQKETTPEQAKLREACVEFEAVMVKQMLEVMQGSVNLFGKGFGGSCFQSMFQEEMARQIAGGKGMGLADMLYRNLQEPEK